jgi:lysophospholipase
LAVLHGYGDHAGRFVHFMQWMADRGVACHAIDFRGHGRSTGRPMYIERWEEYLEDLTAFLATEELATTPTAPPLFVLGHSHGGLVAVAAAMEQRLHCRGLILSAPYLDLKMPVPLHKRIVGVIGSWLFPSLPVRSGVGDEPLSRDPEMNADTKADPLCLGIATPRWFTSATAAQADVRARAAQLTLPLLMLVAGDDTIANPQASVEFFDHCGSTDKTMKRYDDFRHEILRELGRERAFEDILAWLQPRALVPSPSGRGLG